MYEAATTSTVRGLLHFRLNTEVGTVSNPLVTSFSWNKDQTVCTLNGGGSVVFKGLIRGDDSHPYTYIGPSIEVVTEGMELAEWIYTIKHLGRRTSAMVCDVCGNRCKPTTLNTGEVVELCKTCLTEEHSHCESCDEWFADNFDEYCPECVVHFAEGKEVVTV